MSMTSERVVWVLRAALGEEWYDNEYEVDMTIGYAEPRYGSDDAVVVKGNWNPKRWVRDGDKPLTKDERLITRLADALEHAGASIEWCDEWEWCDECHRALRVQPDSYGWTMYGAFTHYGFTCAYCMREDVESYLGEDGDEWGYVNNASRAVTWCGEGELKEAGFVQWKPGDEQRYETGWHPGQDDDPERVLATIRDERGEDVKVVFLIDGVGQFDCAWSAWVKDAEGDER